MAYRWNGNHTEHIGIATSGESTSPVGPYYNIANITSLWGEDPFIWQNDKAFHIIFHAAPNDRAKGWEEWPSRHAWASKDDLYHWNVSKSWDLFGNGAYSTNVTWTDGSTTTFWRRERPEIMFDDDGRPQWLFTGVLERGSTHYSYSAAQPIY